MFIVYSLLFFSLFNSFCGGSFVAKSICAAQAASPAKAVCAETRSRAPLSTASYHDTTTNYSNLIPTFLRSGIPSRVRAKEELQRVAERGAKRVISSGYNSMGDKVFEPFIAGGFAGVIADLVLFPLDTVKTRLQAKEGFWGSGGFKKIYRGLTPQLIVSFPSASAFFVTYEQSRRLIRELLKSDSTSAHVAANAVGGSAGEIAACTVKVPMELVKQRMQVLQLENYGGKSFGQICRLIYQQQGLSGFYVGYGTMIARDVPFTVLQMTTWEFLKGKCAEHQNVEQVGALEGAFCGSIAGIFAAGLTTPLDVAKTRLMTQNQLDKVYVEESLVKTMQKIVRDEGGKALFSGLLPRCVWIGTGGFVFLGAYNVIEKKMKEVRRQNNN